MVIQPTDMLRQIPQTQTINIEITSNLYKMTISQRKSLPMSIVTVITAIMTVLKLPARLILPGEAPIQMFQ